MIYLILSILSSTSIFLLFTLFSRKQVHILTAIVVNYIIAFSFGILFVEDRAGTINRALEAPQWAIAGSALGFIFIAVFYLMALATQRIGVSVSSISSKMSLVLAVLLLSWFNPNGEITIQLVVALLLATAGVILSSLKSEGNHMTARYLAMPLAILIGSTIIDLGIAHYSSSPDFSVAEKSLFACLPFFTAALAGIAIVGIQMIRGQHPVQGKDILAGIVLGIVNYASIYFLVRSYDSQFLPASALLPVNNLSIVALGSILAAALFREKLSLVNWTGVVFAVAGCIMLLL